MASLGVDKDELAAVENVGDLAGFVVLDNWIRNCDRHCIRAGQERKNLENVLLTGENAKAGHVRALAIDHGCAFVCGRALRARDLTIDAVRDETLYGLFEGFKGAVTEHDTARFTERLRSFAKADAAECLSTVPRAWGCSTETADAIKSFCVERAAFLADRLERWLQEPCGWHTFLPRGDAQ